MKEIGRYDSEIQQFVEAPRAFNYPRLKFMRWLAINNRLEHAVAGPMMGEVMPGMFERYGKDALKPLDKHESFSERLRVHVATTGDM